VGFPFTHRDITAVSLVEYSRFFPNSVVSDYLNLTYSVLSSLASLLISYFTDVVGTFTAFFAKGSVEDCQ
jgi:hypothetical protein